MIILYFTLNVDIIDIYVASLYLTNKDQIDVLIDQIIRVYLESF